MKLYVAHGSEHQEDPEHEWDRNKATTNLNGKAFCGIGQDGRHYHMSLAKWNITNGSICIRLYVTLYLFLAGICAVHRAVHFSRKGPVQFIAVW